MRTLRSDRGQAGIALIIIIAWALTAVFMLTRTLVTATKIDNDVAIITGVLCTEPRQGGAECGSGVKGDTALVAKLVETNEIASQILDAAQPLSPKLGVVDDTAKSIDSTVTTILRTVQEIGGTVGGINGNVRSILSVVREIHDGVALINNQAITARGTVGAIQADTSRIREEVRVSDGIHFHACTVDKLLGGLDGHC